MELPDAGSKPWLRGESALRLTVSVESYFFELGPAVRELMEYFYSPDNKLCWTCEDLAALKRSDVQVLADKSYLVKFKTRMPARINSDTDGLKLFKAVHNISYPGMTPGPHYPWLSSRCGMGDPFNSGRLTALVRGVGGDPPRDRSLRAARGYSVHDDRALKSTIKDTSELPLSERSVADIASDKSLIVPFSGFGYSKLFDAEDGSGKSEEDDGARTEPPSDGK
jgi:hypothetical protein